MSAGTSLNFEFEHGTEDLSSAIEAHADSAFKRCRKLGVNRLTIRCQGLPGFDHLTYTGAPESNHLKKLVEAMGERGVHVDALTKINALGLDQDIVRNPKAHRAAIDGMLATIEAARFAGIDTILHYVNPIEPEDPAEDEEIWGNIADIFRELMTQCESSKVRLANHGIWMTVKEPLRTEALAEGLTYSQYRHFRPQKWPGPYLVRSAEHIARLIEVEVPSIYNGSAMCIGMYINYADVPEMVKRFRDRIYFVQVRDLRDQWPEAVEVMPGEGDLDFPHILKLLQDIGYKGMIQTEHYGDPTSEDQDQEAEAVDQLKHWLEEL